MNIPARIAEQPWGEPLRRDGFQFVPAAAMRTALERFGRLVDWTAFAASWHDLPWDEYLAQYGRYRRRRHAVFYAEGARIEQSAQPEPHYQSVAYNPLQGGIERWFEPICPEVASGKSLTSTLRACHELFGSLAPAIARWRVEVHQFRIEARAGLAGQPTPEGMHRDGVDFVLVLLVARRNIASGTTTIHAPDHRELGSFTLTDALDAALVDDARVLHGVTPVEPVDPAQPAYRDVLVVTFKRVAA
jgi:hypothetical protein